MSLETKVITFAARDIWAKWLKGTRPSELNGFVLDALTIENAERSHHEHPNKNTFLIDLRSQSLSIGGCACWGDLVGLMNEFNQDGN
jgi:hypothetical protein